MPRDFFDPTPEEQKIILVDPEILREAENLIESCEFCNKEVAEDFGWHRFFSSDHHR